MRSLSCQLSWLPTQYVLAVAFVAPVLWGVPWPWLCAGVSLRGVGGIRAKVGTMGVRLHGVLPWLAMPPSRLWFGSSLFGVALLWGLSLWLPWPLGALRCGLVNFDPSRL